MDKFHTLVNGENAREHQVGLIHEVETLGESASSRPVSKERVKVQTGNLRINFKAGDAVIRALLDGLQELPTVMEIIEGNLDVNARLERKKI